MHRLIVILALQLALPGLVQAVPAKGGEGRGLDWQPSRTWVVMVSLVEWHNSNNYPSLGQEGRRDDALAAWVRRAGIPPRQFVYLKDKQATRQRIRQELAKLKHGSRKGDLLVLYLAGHGVRRDGVTWFAPYEATTDLARTCLSVGSLLTSVEKHFRGDRALVIGECCHSGALAVEAARRKGPIAYAVLASTHCNAPSTGGWTYINCLLDGLQGNSHVDLNGDGWVDLAELALYAEAEMALAEGQKAIHYISKRFGSTRLARAKEHGKGQQGRVVEVERQGKWSAARIEEVKGHRCRVHYFGEERSMDEWVAMKRVRAYQPRQLPAGKTVKVLWEGKYHPARVLEGKYGLHLVRYQGYGADSDEWVPPQRLRLK